MAYPVDFFGGNEAIFAFGVETGTGYPAAASPALPTAPTAILGGYHDIPEVNSNENAKNGYGAGSPEPLYTISGRREYDISLNTKIGNATLLQNCLRTGSGYKGLPDLALWYGAIGTTGFTKRQRFAKCQQLKLTWNETTPELMANAQFWGLVQEESGLTNLAPTPSQLAASGTPLTFFNLQDITIGGTSLRSVLASVDLTITHNLQRKGGRPDTGDNDIFSRTPYALIPGGQVNYAFELSFHTPTLAAAFYSAAAGSTINAWGPIILTANNTGNTPTGELAQVFNVSIAASRLERRTQRGGETTGEMDSTCSAVISTVSIALV